MKKAINKIIAEIRKNIKKSKTEIKKDFYEIKEKKGKDIAFIDGGNAEIISAPNLSVQIIRIYYCIYRNNKRIKSEKTEFYMLAIAKEKKYDIMIFPYNGKANIRDFSVDMEEKSISFGNKKAEIAKTADIVRRLAELKKAEELASTLKNSVIVLDGDLEAHYPGEKAILGFFKNNNNIIAGLSKTTTLLTEKGDPISNIEREGEWYFKDKNNTYFTRLNDRSRHIFRTDVLNEEKNSLEELFWVLKENSRDLSFPGYPFGLIEADKHARVSNNEKNALKIVFFSKMGDFTKDIEKLSSTINAHEILDRLVSTK